MAAETDNEKRARVECRVPTYRRPELLARALRSLQRQTYPVWSAVVLDDSPENEGQAVVDALADSRIVYRSNRQRLGATGNLDQAFAPASFQGGAYAFVLEDDNAIEPEFIAKGVGRLERGDVGIVSFNQRCVHLGAEIRFGDLLRTSEREELWRRDRLLLNAFLGVSLPNGGYFWKLGAGIDLTVGDSVTEPQLQECIRQTRVEPPIALLPDALSLWSMLPAADIRRQLVSNRRLAANLNQLSAAIVADIGIDRLRELARETTDESLRARFDATLEDLSLISPACRRWFRSRPGAAFRTLVRFYLYRDNLGPTLARLSHDHA